MKINQINNTNFGICRPQPKAPKLYTREQAINILLDKYEKINNQISKYRQEQNDYFDSLSDEEFERPRNNPKLDRWVKYFSIIQDAKIKKAYIEDALDKVTKLPNIANIKLKLD